MRDDSIVSDFDRSLSLEIMTFFEKTAFSELFNLFLY